MKAARSPLAWILATVFLVRLVGVTWGLPASDGWDNDGFAPRGFLSCLSNTFTPGHYDTYPPAHALVLGVLTAPFTVLGLAKAPSLEHDDVLRSVLDVRIMTACALVARLVSAGMSLVIVWVLAKMTEEIHGRRAAWCAAAIAGMHVPFTYYSQTSNLDVPALAWGALALLLLVRAVARREPKRLRAFALIAAVAIATKDQAYALFALAVPISLAAWMLLEPGPGERVGRRSMLREVALATAIGVVSLLVLDGVLVNPEGARLRLSFLVGPASQPFAEYSSDALGRAYLIYDAALGAAKAYPAPVVLLVAAGIVLHVARTRREPERLVAGLVPLAAALSFTLSFVLVARRTDARFVMPQSVLAAMYGGIAADALVFGAGQRFRHLVRAGAALLVVAGLHGVLGCEANLLLDPRYDAEAWLLAHARRDSIETYGTNVYLPRFPPEAAVVRVGNAPREDRHPLPGIEEVSDELANVEARRPRFIVLTTAWAQRYFDERGLGENLHGRVVPETRAAAVADTRTAAYLRALLEGRQPSYVVAHRSRWTSSFWQALSLHGSTAQEVVVCQRVD